MAEIDTCINCIITLIFSFFFSIINMFIHCVSRDSVNLSYCFQFPLRFKSFNLCLFRD